jgi:hypothetical protein
MADEIELENSSLKTRPHPRKIILWLIVAGLILVAVFLVWQKQFGLRLPSGAVETIPETADLELVNQVTDTLKVLVKGAALTQNGFLVLHKDQDGSPGEIIGTSNFLTAGFYQDILISVDSLDFGKNTVFVMIHADDGDEEFKAALDLPLVQDSKIVVESVEVDYQPVFEGGKG